MGILVAAGGELVAGRFHCANTFRCTSATWCIPCRMLVAKCWAPYESGGVHPSSNDHGNSFGSVRRRYRSWADLTRIYRAFAPNAAPHRACDYGEIRSPCTSSFSAAASSHLALVQSEAPPSRQSHLVRLPLLPPTYQSPEPHARVNLLRLASLVREFFPGGLRESVLATLKPAFQVAAREARAWSFECAQTSPA
jgi:hypothetical protein